MTSLGFGLPGRFRPSNRYATDIREASCEDAATPGGNWRDPKRVCPRSLSVTASAIPRRPFDPDTTCRKYLNSRHLPSTQLAPIRGVTDDHGLNLRPSETQSASGIAAAGTAPAAAMKICERTARVIRRFGASTSG